MDVIEQPFSAGMTVEQALQRHPSARWVFAAYHLGGCTHCGASTAETLQEVAAGYEISLERLLSDLNKLLD